MKFQILRSTKPPSSLGRNSSEREFTNGDGSSETSGEAGSPDAAAAGADSEEVEIVVTNLSAVSGGRYGGETTESRGRRRGGGGKERRVMMRERVELEEGERIGSPLQRRENW